MGENSGGDRPFIVKGENAFRPLKRWLKELGCNTYSYSERRKINVGYDTKPDSDWGKYTWRGSIIICSPELFEPVEKVIRAAYGWPEVAE